MHQVTVNITDSSKISFFLDLVKNLNFASVEENPITKSEEAIYKNIEQGLREVKLIEEGKMESTPAKEFLDGL